MKLLKALVILLILMAHQSCEKKKEQSVVLEKWIEHYCWENNSDYEIEMESWHRFESGVSGGSDSLKIGSTLCQSLTIERDQKLPDGIFYADSMIIRFESGKSITFLRRTISNFNPLKRENYEATEDHEDQYRYRYIFTNLDYENAN